MKPIEFITVQDLYTYAAHHHLLDARIRICDGMAVSYYPDPHAVCKGRYELVLDISACEPIDYDELDEHARPWQRINAQSSDELDAYAQACYARERGKQNHRSRRDVEAERLHDLERQRGQSSQEQPARRPKITPETNPDDLPWEIYGYGPRHRRKL